MAAKGRFPQGGAVLLMPLTDAQFEAALEAHELDISSVLFPEGALPPILGILRARHAGMLTHWAEIKAVDRSGAGAPRTVRVKLGPLNRFPRPIEWKQQREMYRPVSVEADALLQAANLDEVIESGQQAAMTAITQAAHFVEFAAPKLDLSRVSRKHLVDQAGSFAAKDPAQAIAQIDAAVTEALRDVVAAFYGEPQEEDEQRDGWFGDEKFKPSVEAYAELLREAEDKELAPLLEVVEHYLHVRARAQALDTDQKTMQVVGLIAVAQAVLEAATGGG